MSMRAISIVVAVLMILGAAAVMLVPSSCGNGLSTSASDRAARSEEMQQSADRYLGGRSSRTNGQSVHDRCDSAMWTRRYIAIPLVIVGVLAILGAAAVSPPKKPDESSESVPTS